MILKSNIIKWMTVFPFILFSCNLFNAINCYVPKSSTIDIYRAKYLQMEADLWSIIENGVDQTSVLHQVLQQHKQFIDQNLTTIHVDQNDFYLFETIFEWKLLKDDFEQILNLFDAFLPILYRNLLQPNNLELNDFAETTMADLNQINNTLDNIENLMIKQGTYYKISLEAQSMICQTRQSAQQVLFQMYNAISIAELKGYAMIQFSWMILRTLGKGNYTKESHLMRQRFEERVARSQKMVQECMKRADRAVWRCDPRHHIEGETFLSVTRLLQGFIENEVDMNNDNTCRENCNAYQFTESYSCYKELFCARQPKCSGKLLNCQFFDSDMWICPSKPTSTRRYEFIEYENGRVLGKSGSCDRTTKVDSWWRWLFWHCSYCLCICDEQGPKSDRYFSLREATSNITANRVVTGVRFTKKNRIIHIQVQDGELGERGSVNATTLSWKPISDFKLLDRGVRNGMDYHTMTWDKRSMDLDDLHAPINHVVTGVRLRIIGTHLNLEIRVTEADFNTGRLIDPETTSFWKSNDNTEISSERRTPLKLKNPDIPTLATSESLIDSKPNQYIEFTHSDVDRDVAQTTVPYIDAQDVVSRVPVALSGAGLYHKGQPNYGGFVGLKLITYDFHSHILPAQLEEDEDFKIVNLP